MDFLWICLILLAVVLPEGSLADLEKQRMGSGLEIYKKLFEVKRKDQMNALKNLIELNDINQQYKIIDIMLKGLFKVLEDSRAVLIAADVPPDGPFPQDEKLKDAYSHVVENTAFFGDVVLRFPKIVHHYFDRNSNWNNLIRWGIGFCNLTGVFEQGPHSQLLGLMAQELGISEKSPNYRNPFKADHSEEMPSSGSTLPHNTELVISFVLPSPAHPSSSPALTPSRRRCARRRSGAGRRRSARRSARARASLARSLSCRPGWAGTCIDAAAPTHGWAGDALPAASVSFRVDFCFSVDAAQWSHGPKVGLSLSNGRWGTTRQMGAKPCAGDGACVVFLE
ncbi:coiled-coil domain-containing protein 134 isoform X1 [Tympanuchus pallidicinctus]|uniref:coiled-coil domain-containing protein 134 isoform X1 n=1 Tax=Tympanuchus pallidicinctus TaxID=109042 RepID=UPI00228725AB|nr:coiled-coil domain-containing protein 134 isoform X1 [Tympanuchus pallidicinctus]XP_052523227.1 coiled-coil domain-containing protein 134 isoform X1 [Tympanuchus pallidicinctus]